MNGTCYSNLSFKELLDIYPVNDPFGHKMSERAKARRIKKKTKLHPQIINHINRRRLEITFRVINYQRKGKMYNLKDYKENHKRM
jgi:hypothetical protein